MNRGILPSLLALGWSAAMLAGCATGPDEANADADLPTHPFAWASERIGPPVGEAAPTLGPEDLDPAVTYFTADDYDAAFDAAVRELRDHGFRLARQDRRFGVITTWPKESPTLFEPWVGDNTTGEQARRSTVNALRRSVEVRLDRADGAASAVGNDYALSVAVTFERRQEPTRYLTHSARGGIAAFYRAVPTHLERQGIPTTYWEPAGEDRDLAHRLLNAITQRSGLRSMAAEEGDYSPEAAAPDPLDTQDDGNADAISDDDR